MRKITSRIFVLLKNSYILTVILLVLGWVAPEGTTLNYCGGLGIVFAIITAHLFVLHLLMVLLSFILRKKS